MLNIISRKYSGPDNFTLFIKINSYSNISANAVLGNISCTLSR